MDPFLEGPFRDDPVNVHALLLADPVDPIRGLVLDRGVPPSIHMDHMVRPGQVHPVAAGLDAQQCDFIPTVIELVEVSLPVGCRSVNPHEFDPALLKGPADEVEHTQEMAENDDLVPSPEDLPDLAHHPVELF